MKLSKRAILTSAVILSVIFFTNYQPAFAANLNPEFPSCVNYNGNLKASYPTGQHAIVGVQGLQSGSDKVFSLNDNNYLQCFCPPTGPGIQTDWLAAGGLTQVEINDFVTRGWTFIPNGADWGLNAQPYLAKNTQYSCSGTGGAGAAGAGITGAGAGAGVAVGEVLGISTLAPTSSQHQGLLTTISLLLGGLILSYGLYLKKAQKK